MDTVLLDKVPKNRRGMIASATTITPRVTGTQLPCPTVEWWHEMKGFDFAWSGEDRSHEMAYVFLEAFHLVNLGCLLQRADIVLAVLAGLRWNLVNLSSEE